MRTFAEIRKRMEGSDKEENQKINKYIHDKMGLL